MDWTKSPGPDGLHGRMIEHLGPVGRQILLDIFNLSWRDGRLPRDWKRAIIIPIKKPGKEAGSPESYRPIALTSIICKIMERMILARLKYFLDLNDLLDGAQYGFRRGHGTTDQVLYMCQKIRDAQNNKPTNHSIAVFLDLSKAFDRVWKHKLIIKLHEYGRINGRALAWIHDFLGRRAIRVKYNNTLSDSYKISQGVPQGSVLTPILFAIYLTGIEELLTRRCEVGIFADDIVLWKSGAQVEEIESDVNLALGDLREFADHHKLILNANKSYVSFFTTNKKLYNYEPRVRFDGQNISTVKHPKYLGFLLDPEFTCNKHIESLITKSRRRLNILKYISGRDWGANAETLRTTYIALIRPILEYGLPVYFCASDSNLQKLERVQLSAARIITGLRNSCPNKIVLYEADLQPLRFRGGAGLEKYFNKLISYGSHNRTSLFLRGWKSNQRLKKNSPMSLATELNLISREVECHSLKNCINPSEGLLGVFFHTELQQAVNKADTVPALMKQMALQLINEIPGVDIQIYTDGSKNEENQSGSGIYIKTPREVRKIKLRNPDNCSVFRSELLAIEAGLEAILNENNYRAVWILSDSRSSIQHLKDWNNVGDRTSISILKLLRHIGVDHEVHLQWIPSHVDIYGNEVADNLAKQGTAEPLCSTPSLTFDEIYSIRKNKDLKTWRVPPSHDWYKRSSPGGSIGLSCDRADQTALSRFVSGHLRSCSFSHGSKVFPVCAKCGVASASPEHILSCLRLSRETFETDPLLALDFLRVSGLMDGV
ncbi:putative RNA-directed DNA polymerase from transposon BS [Araneus ventricosus]|uniref:Putative RNA-directed DNA polymerase from transposon BS n=1 Tax=Araneus ventricosus TaxID=182803 RepID=A0A4Y2B1S0_ARAVE|nr:putative RNA-directed DNA polymerase from transposon BS [Araneus ventricosus]